MSALEPLTDSGRTSRNVRNVPILLKKAKIEQLQKSREGRILGASAAERLHRTDATACGRFRANRSGPSRRRESGAPAVPEKFRSSPHKDFFNSICHKQT
jgi:hypothetical protein